MRKHPYYRSVRTSNTIKMLTSSRIQKRNSKIESGLSSVMIFQNFNFELEFILLSSREIYLFNTFFPTNVLLK